MWLAGIPSPATFLEPLVPFLLRCKRRVTHIGAAHAAVAQRIGRMVLGAGVQVFRPVFVVL